MSKDSDNRELAQKVLDAVGGVKNIATVTHCVTRLRFNLKDDSVPDDDAIRKIPGVIGVNEVAGQYQVIIGQRVAKVYEQLCDIAGIKEESAVEENLDPELKPSKLTPRAIGSLIMNRLVGCLTPIIPVIMVSSMFKMLTSVLGPQFLNLLSKTSDTYQLFTLVGDAGFYFLPVIVGYTAARQFKVTPILGMLLGGILLEPDLVAIVAKGKAFSVFGIPMGLTNYASTILPIILSVWIMSYVERFFKKYLPDSIQPLLTPTLTILVMLPISLTALGPLGGYLGDLVNAGAIAASHLGGIWSLLAMGLIAGFWPILVMSGMHLVLLATALVTFGTVGHDAFILVCGALAGFSSSGIAIGAALKLRDKAEKRNALSYLFANIIGGATEPTLYGVAVRYKRPFIALIVGGFCGGVYASLSHLTMWVMVQGAFILEPTAFVGGGSPANFINGLITGGIAVVVSALITYFWGIPSSENIKRTPIATLHAIVPAN